MNKFTYFWRKFNGESKKLKLKKIMIWLSFEINIYYK